MHFNVENDSQATSIQDTFETSLYKEILLRQSELSGEEVFKVLGSIIDRYPGHYLSELVNGYSAWKVYAYFREIRDLINKARKDEAVSAGYLWAVWAEFLDQLLLLPDQSKEACVNAILLGENERANSHILAGLLWSIGDENRAFEISSSLRNTPNKGVELLRSSLHMARGDSETAIEILKNANMPYDNEQCLDSIMSVGKGILEIPEEIEPLSLAKCISENCRYLEIVQRLSDVYLKRSRYSGIQTLFALCLLFGAYNRPDDEITQLLRIAKDMRYSLKSSMFTAFACMVCSLRLKEDEDKVIEHVMRYIWETPKEWIRGSIAYEFSPFLFSDTVLRISKQYRESRIYEALGGAECHSIIRPLMIVIASKNDIGKFGMSESDGLLSQVLQTRKYFYSIDIPSFRYVIRTFFRSGAKTWEPMAITLAPILNWLTLPEPHRRALWEIMEKMR